MLEKLFDLNYFDYRNFILNNASKLELLPEEAFVFIKVLDNYHVDHKIHFSELEGETNLSKERLQDILSKLLELSFYEGYLAYENGVGDEFISVRPFFSHVERILNNKKTDITKDLPNVVSYLEEEFQRLLTATELEMIQAFVMEDGYNLDSIKEAVNLCKKKKRSVSVKNISMMFAYVDNPDLVKKENAIKTEQNKSLAELYKKMGR